MASASELGSVGRCVSQAPTTDEGGFCQSCVIFPLRPNDTNDNDETECVRGAPPTRPPPRDAPPGLTTDPHPTHARVPAHRRTRMMIQAEHWRFVRSRARERPSDPPPATRARVFLRLASLGRLKPSTAPSRLPPRRLPRTPPHLAQREEDKLFENSLAQLGDLEGDDPFKQVSARALPGPPPRLPAVGDPPTESPSRVRAAAVLSVRA